METKDLATKRFSMRSTLKDVSLFDIQNFPEANGSVAVLEGQRHLGFDIKRVFYVYGVDARDVRGEHAHLECQQVLVCIRGCCHVTCDDGKEKKTFVLDTPTRGLYLPPGIWADQKYMIGGTVLMVLCDRWFTETDYVRDYEDFQILRSKSSELE